jgi:hypothetical protein
MILKATIYKFGFRGVITYKFLKYGFQLNNIGKFNFLIKLLFNYNRLSKIVKK